ncbi:MAG: glycosyltransferase, partial [Lentilactobacillus parabuchneri]|nr:glycosyltransferase [Lentilactobacillus parabuchneri]
MNIGIFTDTYFPQVSGVATSIKTLKNELERQGNQVYIFTTTDPHVDKDTYEQNIFRFSSIPFISFTDRRIAVRGLFQAYEIAKELNLDIVHTQTEFSMGMIGKFVAKNLNIPCIHTYHTMYEDYLHYVANGKLLRPV